jgi:hypothetical protein
LSLMNGDRQVVVKKTRERVTELCCAALQTGNDRNNDLSIEVPGKGEAVCVGWVFGTWGGRVVFCGVIEVRGSGEAWRAWDV